MKLLHLSNTGLGSSLENGMRWDLEREMEIRASLSRVFSRAKELEVSVVLITGGLFSHQAVRAELEEAAAVFSEYPQIRVIIASGERDILKKSSPVHSFIWPANVSYHLTGGIEKTVLPEFSAVVFSAGLTDWDSADPESDRTAQLFHAASEYTGTEKIRIAMLCKEEPERLVSLLEQEDPGFSYIALGTRARFLEAVKGKAFYSGSLEPEGIRDGGEHGGVLVSLDDGTGELLSAEFVPLASLSYIPLVMKLTPSLLEEDLLEIVENEILRRGVNNIYRVRFTGKRDPELRTDLAKLSALYRIREVIDESEPVYDLDLLYSEHRKDIIGFYINRLKNRFKNNGEMSALEKEAMFYGIDALIKTADKEKGN